MKRNTYVFEVTVDPLNLAGLPVYERVLDRLRRWYRARHEKIRQCADFRLTYSRMPSARELVREINRRSVEMTGVRPYRRFSGECMVYEVVIVRPDGGYTSITSVLRRARGKRIFRRIAV